MHTTSISTAQQLAADRHAAYEGVATRGRLRRLARRTASDPASATFAPRPTARFVAPRIAAEPQPQPARRKVA
jgi:hypothetical protein